MNRLVDDDSIMELYSEGKLTNALAIGAMAASSVLGGTIDSVEDFIGAWSNHYQTKNDPVKEKRVRDEIENGVKVPQSALASIGVAVDIFGGDMDVEPLLLRDLLILTGDAESGYRTKVQTGGGPARSYWQVEPATAYDHFATGSELMGPKFQKQFPREFQIMNDMLGDPDIELIQDLLLNNDDFGAAMAAMTWVRRL
jgi:hypothetical protein